jgi:GNAT superfamily N-acetyltransferase
MNFNVIRDPDTQKVVSVAQWSSDPEQPPCSQETPEEVEERQSFEDEVYRRSLPQGSNKDLIMEFTIGLRNLRQQVLQGRKHYMLENLATHPNHRRKGLASRLVQWIVSQADGGNALVYLDTASDNIPAISMYNQLGFAEQGRHTINDISRFVGQQARKKISHIPEHTHVAFVKVPSRDLA